MRALSLTSTLLLAASAGCYQPPEERTDAGDPAAIAESLEGCQYIGGLNRVGFRGVAKGPGLCAAFILVEAFGDDPELDVKGWTVEGRTVHAAPCASWGRGDDEPRRSIRGSVRFDAVTTELPPAAIDVFIGTGRGSPPEIRLVGNVSDFSRSCL